MAERATPMKLTRSRQQVCLWLRAQPDWVDVYDVMAAFTLSHRRAGWYLTWLSRLGPTLGIEAKVEKRRLKVRVQEPVLLDAVLATQAVRERRALPDNARLWNLLLTRPMGQLF